MSWSEVKVHKQSSVHQMRSLRIAATDLSAERDGSTKIMDETDGFQLAPFWQRTMSPQAMSLGAAAKGPEEFVTAGASLREQQEQELCSLLTTLALSLEELGRLREQILKNSTEDMLRLVLAVAEQVVHCEVTVNPEIIVETLQNALQSAISSDQYHVKVHPEDLALVMEKKPLFLASVSGLKNITLEGDECVSRGGCLVESELGRVDATIEGQVRELRQKLLPAVTAE